MKIEQSESCLDAYQGTIHSLDSRSLNIWYKLNTSFIHLSVNRENIPLTIDEVKKLVSGLQELIKLSEEG